jgi:UDP-N-acetylmuramoylalanine--D-glutamate ligase
MERWPGPVLGITGSNGKSTTTTLCHAVLAAGGARAALGGNIGGSLLERLDGAEQGDVAVLEISSFMLEMLAPLGLGPDVAVITNITPNHLDRHGSFEAYKEAKRLILRRARRAVLNGDDPHVRDVARGFAGEALWFGKSGDASVSEDGSLVDRRGWTLLASDEIPLAGRVNRLNLSSAWLAAAAVLGDEVRAARALSGALARYEPPPHRLDPVGEWDGIAWVDDSSSTTPESTRGSLEAVGGPCVLIAGGHDKGLDPEPLLDGARRWARVVLTIGEQAPNLLRELARRGVTAEAVGTVEAAVARAAQVARPGETVLLSPGYSSHDQFTNYEKRAERFREQVLKRVTGSRMSAG